MFRYTRIVTNESEEVTVRKPRSTGFSDPTCPALVAAANTLASPNAIFPHSTPPTLGATDALISRAIQHRCHESRQVILNSMNDPAEREIHEMLHPRSYALPVGSSTIPAPRSTQIPLKQPIWYTTLQNANLKTVGVAIKKWLYALSTVI